MISQSKLLSTRNRCSTVSSFLCMWHFHLAASSRHGCSDPRQCMQSPRSPRGCSEGAATESTGCNSRSYGSELRQTLSASATTVWTVSRNADFPFRTCCTAAVSSVLFHDAAPPSTLVCAGNPRPPPLHLPCADAAAPGCTMSAPRGIHLCERTVESGERRAVVGERKIGYSIVTFLEKEPLKPWKSRRLESKFSLKLAKKTPKPWNIPSKIVK